MNIKDGGQHFGKNQDCTIRLGGSRVRQVPKPPRPKEVSGLGILKTNYIRASLVGKLELAVDYSRRHDRTRIRKDGLQGRGRDEPLLL